MKKRLKWSLPFFMLISQNIKGFTTVYYNSTFSEAYSSFNSFRVDKYKQA